MSTLFSLRHKFVADTEQSTATTSLTLMTVDTVYIDPDDPMVQYCYCSKHTIKCQVESQIYQTNDCLKLN